MTHSLVLHGCLDDNGNATYWAECSPCQWTGPHRKTGDALHRHFDKHAHS